MEPMIEHANPTLEIVDLLQALTGDCKCEAKHMWTYESGPRIPMNTPCEGLAAYRYVHHCFATNLLVCKSFYRDVMETLAGDTDFCFHCEGQSAKLIPV